MFEDIRHERSSILLLSLTDSNILKQCKITDQEISLFKNLVLEKLLRQKWLKKYFALQALE